MTLRCTNNCYARVLFLQNVLKQVTKELKCNIFEGKGGAVE